MHSMQCLAAQHDVLLVQHAKIFKGREPSRALYSVKRPLPAHFLVVFAANPPDHIDWITRACLLWRMTCVHLLWPPAKRLYGGIPYLSTITQMAVRKGTASGEMIVNDTFCPAFCFPTARSVWSSCSHSISAKSTSRWSLTRIRSGKFSSIRSSSSSLWVANIITSSDHHCGFFLGHKLRS